MDGQTGTQPISQPAWQNPRPALRPYRHRLDGYVVDAAKILSMAGDRLTLEMPGPQGEPGAIDIFVSPTWLQRAEGQVPAIVGSYYAYRTEGSQFIDDCWMSSSFEAVFEALPGWPTPVPAQVMPTELRPPVLRTIDSHQVNEANGQLTIGVLDEPGPGGASHLFDIRGFNSASNPSDPFVGRYGEPAKHSTVLFQQGDPSKVGVNGVTHEALLAIVRDRITAFQAGPHACDENKLALIHLEQAIRFLQSRTRRRQEAGTEGTHNGC
jgi:hypothetical protein